jgi:tetratricopeptide (TPR) repeat protein
VRGDVTERRVLEVNNLRKTQKAAEFHERGRQLYNLGLFVQALELYDRALALNPYNEQIWYDKGNVFRNWERLRLVGEDVPSRQQEAIECYKRAVSIDPNYADAWGNMGVSYGLMGNHQQALECFEKALGIHPEDAQWLHMKAVALQKLGKVQEAFEAYAKAERLDPRFKNPMR